jgi:hypothetical protein
LRDFAFTLTSLIKLGHAERCKETLNWILEHYSKKQRITPFIEAEQGPLEPHGYTCDSLPFLIYCLDTLKQESLTSKHHSLLKSEAQLYADILLDPDTGDLKTHRSYGGFKHSLSFPGSCTDHSMVAWCTKLLSAKDIHRGLEDRARESRAMINQWFWAGQYFRNDTYSSPPICSADANFWPYWCDLVDQRELRLPLSIEAIHDQGLDEPMPLKYHRETHSDLALEPFKNRLPNYQGNSVCTLLSSHWIELVKALKPQRADRYKVQINDWLEAEGNWHECLDATSQKILKGPRGFQPRSGMIWAANFLAQHLK